jgi:glycosyltransferase involved in cell wall biosynthesis
LNILLGTIYSYAHSGGLSSYIVELKKGLEERGHKVDVIANTPDFSSYYRVSDNVAYLIEDLEATIEKPISKLSEWNSFTENIEWERLCFERALLKFGLEDYDIIHAQDVISAISFFHTKPLETPLITTLHGCLVTECTNEGRTKKNSIAYQYLLLLDKIGIEISHLAITPSKWLKQHMIEKVNAPSDKLVVINSGIDLDEFISRMEEPTAIKASANKKVIACTARLSGDKGHEHLLKALSLLKKVRTDWVCWLIGDGPKRRNLMELVQKKNLTDHVLFLGTRNDVPAILKQADIFVLPSLQENLPYAIMEAQIAGLPVVATETGGVPEMIQDGLNGLLTPFKDHKALFHCLKTLLENPKFAQKLGEKNKHFSKKWGKSDFITKIEEVYLLCKGESSF